MRSEIDLNDLEKYVGKQVLIVAPKFKHKVFVQKSMGPVYMLLYDNVSYIAHVSEGIINTRGAKLYKL